MQNRAAGIILAGGLGTRISQLHPDVPKPMIEVANRPFLEWVLRNLQRQGVNRLVVSLGHLAHVCERYLATRDGNPPVRSVRELQPLGTGGGFLLASAATEGADPLVLVNGDSLLTGDWSAAWTALANDQTDAVLLAVRMDDASRYGTLEVDATGRLIAFREKQPGRGLVNAGVYLMKRRLLAQFPRATRLSMETDVFPSLLNQGARLHVEAIHGGFLDIGTPHSLAQADAFIRSQFQLGAAA